MRSLSDRSDHLAEWAHAYAARLGWPVFPLAPKAKTPLTKNGFKDASVLPDQITTWWTKYPDANIGLPTGIAFDVLDIDGPDGATALRSRFGIEYHHSGPVASTGKGWHLLFTPTGQGNGANLINKVDFRGKGGYIVAPPSLHPLGHYYAWARGRGPNLALPPAPDWLLELLARDDNPARNSRQLIAPADPTKPATTWMDLVTDQRYPKDQLPSALRQRGDRPSILEVCNRRGIPLRRRASYYQTKCIFHDDSTPSMAIYPHDNSFHCYGCGAHGDSFDLDKETPTHI